MDDPMLGLPTAETTTKINANDSSVADETEAPSVKSELLTEALGWAKTIVFAVVLALVINNFIIVNASVPTGSMMDTIQVNDRIIAFRLAYLFSNPQRFDIIVFRCPDDGVTLYVKRIVGLPGDLVNIINGNVYINNADRPLRDDFVRGEHLRNYGPFEVPEGKFFVLGDNRSNSIDSRHWTNQFVAQDTILGRVIFRYFPGFRSLTVSE